MTIKKRNRLVRMLAGRIARLDGGVATMGHQAEAAVTGHGCTALCVERVCNDAERNTYDHLAGRRVYRSRGRAYLRPGLPRLRAELVTTRREYDRVVESLVECAVYRPYGERGLSPPPGWEARAIEAARAAGVIGLRHDAQQC